MSSCKALAERYAKETQTPIPADSASTQTKQDWLLKQTWGCKLSDGTFHPGPASGGGSFCYDTLGHQSTSQEYKPFLNYLQEEGFLAWVNEKSMKCINKIVGRFYGFNEQTGTSNQPGPSVTPPDSQCWGACWNVTQDSETCFECIKQVLSRNPSLCPSLNVDNPEDDDIMKDSLDCYECVSLSGGLVEMPGATPDASPVPDNDAMIDNIWNNCITGSMSESLSTTAIILIVIGCIFIVALAIFLGLWFGVFHKPRVNVSTSQNVT